MIKTGTFVFILGLGVLNPLDTPPNLDRAMRLSSLPAKQRRLFAAIYTTYSSEIDSVRFRDHEVLFYLKNDSIYFAGGRMLNAAHVAHSTQYSPVVYPYIKGTLTSPPGPGPIARCSSDFLALLYGKSEKTVRRHCREAHFLGRFVFMNVHCLPALQRVEKSIHLAAKTSKAVRDYIDNLEVAYSFKRKKVIGAGHRSLHSFGLAIDLVPRDYDGKHVYWKWSRVFHGEEWPNIPLKRRWHPPQAVVDAFEANGFVWGGKWNHFDTIHFEYRPEILALADKSGSGI